MGVSDPVVRALDKRLGADSYHHSCVKNIGKTHAMLPLPT